MRRRRLRTSEEKVRRLQERLHLSAKRDPARRFHQLYDKVASPWVLEMAWQRVARNKGSAGPDGVRIEDIRAAGAESFLEELGRELRERGYRGGPVRRVYIPKANGKMRPLGIPNVRDRVVQMATLLVLSPIFEADLPNSAYGFRKGRSAHQAIERIRRHMFNGLTEVVDCDLAAFFDTIPHGNLLKLVARRVVDRGVLNLIKGWLRAPVIDPEAGASSAGGRRKEGTPQGGVISPLLANIYHACIPYLWEKRGHAERFGGQVVSYADDFVLMVPVGRGQMAHAALQSICQRLSLTLSEEKTRVIDATRERLPFLGFEVQMVCNPKTGKRYPRVVPARKSEARLREKVRSLLNYRTRNHPVPQVIREVNELVRGWGAYFYYGHPQRSMHRINHFVEERLRKWLMRRRQKRGPGYSHYPSAKLYGPLGLYRLPMTRPGATAKA